MKDDGEPLGLLMGNTLRVLGKNIRLRFTELNMPVSPDQFGLLNLMDQKEESLQTELANIMAKDKSAVLRQLDHLETNGLIRRSIDENDRRKKNLIITPKGAELLKQGREIIDELMNDFTENVSQKDLKVFREVLSQIKNKAG